MATPPADPVLVQIAPYMVALASIVVSVLVVSLSRRHDRSAWLTDRRLAAYADFINAGVNAWTVLCQQYFARYRGAPPGVGDEDEINGVLQEASKAANVVELLGPEEVGVAAADALERLRDLGKLISDHQALTAVFPVHGEKVQNTAQAIAVRDFNYRFHKAAGSVVQETHSWWRRIRKHLSRQTDG